VPHSEVFILFPETDPIHPFIERYEGFQTEEELNQYFATLILSKKSIEIENYLGFYDIENVKQFLDHYDILNDFYLINPSRILRTLLKEWINWRDEIVSSFDGRCELLGQELRDNSFCEVSFRKIRDTNNTYSLASHKALTFPLRTHSLSIEGKAVNIDCLSVCDLPNWFSTNRVPRRTYHPNPKHGENGIGEWLHAAKLLCSHSDAEAMLQRAIGCTDIDELYYFDSTYHKFIIFRFEGDNPQHQYHAYHIENENEIPRTIKNLHAMLHV
jgi:hypothetical protein